MPLKGISSLISPDLLHALASMGHGDEIVIADGNFPAASHAQRLIRADGIDAVPLLHAILQLFPIDNYVDDHAVVMEVVKGDTTPNPPPIWASFESELKAAEGPWVHLTPIERHAFYDRAKKAYAIVATSEKAVYANIILKKGVIKPSS